MTLDNMKKVECICIEPPKFNPSKAMSIPRRHKQIKKAQNIKQGIAEKCDIHKREE